MSITRRKFLKAGTLVALSAAIPLKVAGQQPRQGNDANPIDQAKEVADPLSTYTRSTFSSYLNSLFRLYTGYSTIDVALVEVKELAPWSNNKVQNGAECFSLLFRGGSVALKQNTYKIEHPSLGSFALFLTPGTADDNGAQSFVAIINRLSFSEAQRPAPTRLSKGHVIVAPQEPVTPAPATPAPAKTNTPAPTTTPPNKIKPPKRRGGDNDFEGVID